MSEYLAIKNWKKYQTLRGGGKWIKDYTYQEEDEAMSKLSFFQRMVLQGIRRICGRLGKNVPNDPHYICNQLNALRTDRPRVRNAIDTLIEQQWLSVMGSSELCSEQVGDLYKERIEKRERTKPSRTAKPPCDPRFRLFVEVLSRYHGKFVGEKLSFQLWFGHRGGKQLKTLLKAEPDLDVGTFEKAVAMRARSPGVRHEQAVFEWIFHVLSGPKGVANGNGQVGKAQQRHDRNDEKYRRVLSEISPGAGRDLPLGDDGGGTRALPGIVESIPLVRGKGSGA